MAPPQSSHERGSPGRLAFIVLPILLVIGIILVLASNMLSTGVNSTPIIGIPATPPSFSLRRIGTDRVSAETVSPVYDNCAGSGAIERTINRGRSTTVEISLTTSLGIEFEAVVKAQLGIELNVKEGETISVSDELKLSIAPQSRLRYEIQWYETWDTGEVVLPDLNQSFPYRVRRGFDAEVVNSQRETCGTDTLTASPTATSSGTTTPNETPTLSAEQILQTITAEAAFAVQTADALHDAAMNQNPLIRFPASSVQLGNPLQRYPFPAVGMNQYEVSRAQYTLCIEAGICTAVSGNDETIDHQVTNELPMTSVTARQAWEFCAWLGLRLPSGAEWERVIRGTDGRVWPWGNRPVSDDRANVIKATNDNRKLAAVDTYSEGATPEGIHHLVGNASEWTRTPETCGLSHYTCTDLWDGQSEVGTLMIYDFGIDGIIGPQDTLDNLLTGIPTQPSVTAPTLGFRCASD